MALLAPLLVFLPWVAAQATAAAQVAAPPTAPEVIRPGENLVLDGVPDMPAELQERLRRYQEVRSAWFQDWLPDGGMLITTRFADTQQVHRVPLAGGRREQLTFLSDRVAWARACPRKGCGYFLYARDRGGDEFYQLYRKPLAGGEATLLTDGKSRHGEAIWDRAGKLIAYHSTRRNGRDFDLYLMDPERPAEARLLLEVEGMWLPLDFSPDGKTLLAVHYVSIQQSHLWRVDTATGEKRPLTPPGERETAYAGARFSPDGKRIYLLTDRGHEFVRLMVQDAAREAFEPRPVLPKALGWDVEGFDLSADGRTLAYLVNAGGRSELGLWDLGRGKPLPPPALAQGIATGLRFRRDGGGLAFSLTGSRIPGDAWGLMPGAKAPVRWTHSELGDLPPENLVEPELISFPTFDDDGPGKRQIPAWLYLPPQERFKPPYPVVISFHGGPEAQARPWFLGVANQRIAELGIALIQPNVRGSSGYGKTFVALDNGKLREDAVRDAGALLDFIAARPELDARRVAVSGGSYGGYMSLASLVQYPERLACGVSYVGISSFVTFLESTQAYRRDLRRVEYGDERDPGMRMYLEMISPLTNAERIQSPLLVLQGERDPRVPASEAEQIVARVRSKGGQVWYLLARDEGHGFAKKPNSDFANLVTTRFLEHFLLGR